MVSTTQIFDRVIRDRVRDPSPSTRLGMTRKHVGSRQIGSYRAVIPRQPKDAEESPIRSPRHTDYLMREHDGCVRFHGPPECCVRRRRDVNTIGKMIESAAAPSSALDFPQDDITRLHRYAKRCGQGLLRLLSAG